MKLIRCDGCKGVFPQHVQKQFRAFAEKAKRERGYADVKFHCANCAPKKPVLQ